MSYHVTLWTNTALAPEIKLDLTYEQLLTRFVEPYVQGRAIVIGGKTIKPDNIQRIRITLTDIPSDGYIEQVIEELGSGYDRQYDPNMDLRPALAAAGEDVTDDFLTAPQGSQVSVTTSDHQSGVDPRYVFVVHGRNLKARTALFRFLRAIDLHPIEWEEAIAALGQPTPYIGEILDAGFALAQAVVVLRTPDDEGRLRERNSNKGGKVHEEDLTPQARLNVVYEEGMAKVSHKANTIIVEFGAVRGFSDTSGQHVIRLNDTPQQRQALVQRLRHAKCAVNTQGLDWYTEGDFDDAVKEIKKAIPIEDEDNIRAILDHAQVIWTLVQQDTLRDKDKIRLDAERDAMDKLIDKLDQYTDIRNTAIDLLEVSNPSGPLLTSKDAERRSVHRSILSASFVLLQAYAAKLQIFHCVP